LLDARQQRTYLELFLPMAVGLKTSTACVVLSEGEQTMEAWAAIFRHLPRRTRGCHWRGGKDW
jgi:hypothetical protein